MRCSVDYRYDTLRYGSRQIAISIYSQQHDLCLTTFTTHKNDATSIWATHLHSFTLPHWQGDINVFKSILSLCFSHVFYLFNKHDDDYFLCHAIISNGTGICVRQTIELNSIRVVKQQMMCYIACHQTQTIHFIRFSDFQCNHPKENPNIFTRQNSLLFWFFL